MEVLHCNAQPSAGRSFALRLNLWKKISAPYMILCWIKNGVPLPLHNVPRLCILRNFHLDNLQTLFVEEELSRLLCLGAICPLGHLETPHVSSIGVVPKKNCGSRLIINMRLLNIAISPPCFKYKDLALLAPLLKEGDYMTMINLKDGFFHVPVLPSHQSLMSFWWEGKTYVFQVLPFGMSALPWLFTCFVQAMVHHLLRQGMRVMAYMDNFIIIGHSHQQALEHTTRTLSILDQLGWQVNFEKSDLTPSQSKEFLGLLINTTGPPSFKVPPRKSHTLRHNIDCLLRLFIGRFQIQPLADK